MKEYRDARKYLAYCIEHNPNDLRAYWILSMVCTKLMESDKNDEQSDILKKIAISKIKEEYSTNPNLDIIEKVIERI